MYNNERCNIHHCNSARGCGHRWTNRGFAISPSRSPTSAACTNGALSTSIVVTSTSVVTTMPISLMRCICMAEEGMMSSWLSIRLKVVLGLFPARTSESIVEVAQLLGRRCSTGGIAGWVNSGRRKGIEATMMTTFSSIESQIT